MINNFTKKISYFFCEVIGARKHKFIKKRLCEHLYKLLYRNYQSYKKNAKKLLSKIKSLIQKKFSKFNKKLTSQKISHFFRKKHVSHIFICRISILVN